MYIDSKPVESIHQFQAMTIQQAKRSSARSTNIPTSLFLGLNLLLFLFLPMITDLGLQAQIGWNKSYEHGLVVSADGIASQVGRQILQQGGNAVDAAIAVQFALAVTLPRAGNLGGGGFMVVHLADGTTATLDFRERAPGRAYRDMYLDEDGNYLSDLSKIGALAAGVPGTVDGMVQAHERFGSLPWRDLVSPAIALAREGYSLSWSQAASLNGSASSFAAFEGSRNYFWPSCKEEAASQDSHTIQNDNTVVSTGEIPSKACRDFEEGDVFIQTDLAQTLEAIAEQGREGFYGGWVANKIVETMTRYDGFISAQDLADYESVWRTPYRVNFKGYELHIMPPPSSGSIAVGQILEMMQTQDIDALAHHSAVYYHLLAEAMRRAFADRAHYLGDPDFYDVPTEQLSTREYAEYRMADFNPSQATPSESVSHGELTTIKESYETTHFSVIDSEGNAVGITTTLNGSFGSKLAVEGAGFLLNNEMDDFSAQPGTPNMFGLLGGEANAIAPGKRMLSSMTPIIVSQDGKVKMIAGAAGGPRIITATLQNVLNVLLFGMNAQQANAAPRIHHQWYPDQLYVDNLSMSADTKSFLELMGHTIRETSLARVHSIVVDDQGRYTGGVDPRGDGYAAGY